MENWKSKLKPLSLATACVVAAAAQPALAGWNSSQESISGMNTWIYTPDTPSSQPRSMMLVLHGCAQTNTELKTHGNLEAAAEAHNAVMVVPYRPSAWTGNSGANCWAYDGGDSSQAVDHSDKVISMVNTLAARTSLNIDADSIYVTGLSSGAGMSLILGCKAPDLFAGVDAVSGPTVGSSQMSALQTPFNPSQTISTGISKCNSLASGKASDLDTQITHITWGDQDKDGDHPGPAYSQYGTNPPGQTALVSVVYATSDVEVMKDVYGTTSNTSTVTVTSYGGSGADQTEYYTGSDVRLASLAIDDVGHAWPAGKTPGNASGAGGTWMAQHDMDYPLYIMDWFEDNNMRKVQNNAPVISIPGPNPVYVVECDSWSAPIATATDVEDGDLSSSIVVTGDNFNTCNLGTYTVTYSVTDSGPEPKTTTATLTVEVLDGETNTPPSITLNGAAAVSISVGDNWVDPLATATDEEDGDLTSALSVSGTVNNQQEGTYTLTYTVSDNGTQLNGQVGTPNTVSVQRTVEVGSKCWTEPLSAHMTAGRAATSGGFVCQTVGGGDQLPDYTYTCEYVRDFGGDTTYSITETSPGVYNKVADCNGTIPNNDADNDGVINSLDLCPNTPAGDTVDADGCTVVIPGGCEDHSTANYYHKTAGRAYSTGSVFSPDYFANGSDDAMAGSTWGQTTLKSTDGGANWFVGACP